jgi:RNA polymerase sigma-70 factor (ECF subfamily)
MATATEIDDFLKSTQRRAFKMARYACRQDEEALDIVQDSMIKLCEKYSDRPSSELPALFGRILQNRINDHFRKDKTLSKINILYEDFSTDEHDGFDFVSALSDQTSVDEPNSPESDLSRRQTRAVIEEALQTLPERQRQAFLLRHWEGMDTEQAADSMGVTPGSVKTHLSRATRALAEFLTARGIRL